MIPTSSAKHITHFASQDGHDDMPYIWNYINV